MGNLKTINFPFEINGKLMISGVPVLKHFMVNYMQLPVEEIPQKCKNVMLQLYKPTYCNFSTNLGVLSLSMAVFVTNMTLGPDKLTLKLVVAPAPNDVLRMNIEVGSLLSVDVTFSTVPIGTSSEMLIDSVSSDHTGAE